MANTALDAAISQESLFHVFVDGVFTYWVQFDDFDTDTFRSWRNFNIGRLSAGSHSLRLVADATELIDESNENDNIYKRTFTVTDAEGGGSEADHQVDIMNFTFSPQNLTIEVGATIEWINRDTAPHTSTSDTGVWDSGTLPTGESFQRTFAVPGTFPYHCGIHPSMTATVTVSDPGGGGQDRKIRVVDAQASVGGTVELTVQLDAQGDENAVGFSLVFPPNDLTYQNVRPGGGGAADATINTNASQAAAGRLGITLALASGNSFSKGTHPLVVITFDVPGESGDAIPVSFGDQPVAREVSDAGAAAVPADFIAGRVTLSAGLEGDVAPRPDGNGSVTITDWVQIGRFSAGLDTASTGAEYQKADCAPRDASGNGSITVTDWVQAGRYAAGLDPQTPAGGPASVQSLGDNPGRSGQSDWRMLRQTVGTPRTVRLQGLNAEPGSSVEIPLILDAVGDENALGFSVQFNPESLVFREAALGSAGTGASLHFNVAQADKGSVGVALARNAGETFPAGELELVLLSFDTTASAGLINIGFADFPVVREISDALARELPVIYTGATIVLSEQSVPIRFESIERIDGNRVRLILSSKAGTTIAIESSSDALRWDPLEQMSNPTGSLTLTYPVDDTAKFYRAKLVQ